MDEPTSKVEVLTPSEVAGEYKIPRRTLDQWRYLGKGPAFYKIGKHVRYKRHEVEDWFDLQAAR